jgi:hypothetical protein
MVGGNLQKLKDVMQGSDELGVTCDPLQASRGPYPVPNEWGMLLLKCSVDYLVSGCNLYSDLSLPGGVDQRW